MNPFLSNLRTVLLSGFLYLLIGSFFASLLAFAQLSSWSNALLFSLPNTLLLGLISSSAYYVCRSLPLAQRRFWIVCSLFGGASGLTGLLWLALCLTWNKICTSLGDPTLGIVLNTSLQAIIFLVGAFLYLMAILAYDVLIAFENMRHSELREAASQVLAREAELQVLRTQINPHFLFNSLNSISALTTIDPSCARNMTIELAQFFRLTLALSERQKIQLKEEIALCNHFLAIEKIRFGRKLQVQINAKSDSENALIPPMLLQPLLENAIKHGIRDLVDGGTIEVHCQFTAPWLYIAIENPIDSQPAQTQGTGTGLKNCSARLRSLYGDKARIDWRSEGLRFRVEIVLPFETAISHEDKS